MKLRICLGIVGIMAFLFCSVSAAGISFNDVISGGSSNAGISIAALPPRQRGVSFREKHWIHSLIFLKTSDRLLNEAEISRDIAKKQWDAAMVKYTAELNQRHGTQYTVEFVTYQFRHSQDPLYTPEMIEARDSYEYANKKYNAVLAATGEKDYDEKARIFDSATVMYAGMGATEAMEITENAALAARAQAAAQKISLPLSVWIAVFAIIGGLILIQRKKN